MHCPEVERRLPVLLAFLVLSLALPQPGRADAVVGTGTAGSCTKAALNAALAIGGSVTFNCGPNPVAITVTSLKTITVDTMIDGGSLITLSGGGTTSILTVNKGVTLSVVDLAITDAYDILVGAITNSGTLNVTHSTFSGNNSIGAIFNTGGTLNVTHSMFSKNSTVADNSATAIVNTGGMVSVTDSMFSGNSTVADNSATAIVNGGGTMSITDSTFSTNSGGYNSGGAINNNGTLNVTDSTFSKNSGYAGPINSGGLLNVTGTTFEGNSAYYGGAIENAVNGTVKVSNSTFSDNSVSAYGGAIYNYGTLRVSNSTFSDNSVSPNGGLGTIYNRGSVLSVTGSTFFGNGGGAIYNAPFYNASFTFTVTNSTFLGNSGGAIYSDGSYTPTKPTNMSVINSTFSGNGGDNAISSHNNATVTLVNTILSDGCNGSIADGGHNLQSGTSCPFSSARGSFTKTDPLLDPAGLANNGGPTHTIALQAGSLAIDAGDETICAAAPVNNLDQRGYVRPGTGATNCSIGAYEYNSPGPPCVGDCNGHGQVTVDEILTMVNIALGNADVSACMAGDANKDGEITVDEILTAVNNALNGCPAILVPTPTVTPSPSSCIPVSACSSAGFGCGVATDCCSCNCYLNVCQ